jgi:stearoyl-CoA desaturase (delta-9 desaturase)
MAETAAPVLPKGIVPDPRWERRRIVYSAVMGIVGLGGAFGLAYALVNGVGAVEVSCFLAMYVLMCLGEGACHRYFTHKSFETSKAGRVVLATLGALALQGPIVDWVANHRRHHAHTDGCGDPHSPYVDHHCHDHGGAAGFWHAFFGWLIADLASDPKVYAKDIADDRLLLWFGRTRHLWYFLSIIGIPALWGYAFGGAEAILPTVLVGGFLRSWVFVCSVFALNSLGHSWGTQRYEGGGQSRNNAVISLLLLGEGWHNNHHRYPRNAYAGLAWWEFDPIGRAIVVAERLGLVWKVVRVRTEFVVAREGGAKPDAPDAGPASGAAA